MGSLLSVLGTVGGALVKGAASALIGIFQDWLTKRRIEQLGRQEAVLEYERKRRKASERMRGVRDPDFKRTVDRLRNGQF
jgi:ribosomal protein L21